MRDLEVAKNRLPISIWGVPIRKWAGRVKYSHMGSPRFRIEFVSIWGSTYIYISSLGSYLRVKYVSSGMMNEWKSNFGAVGGWTNVCIPCLIRLLNA